MKKVGFITIIILIILIIGKFISLNYWMDSTPGHYQAIKTGCCEIKIGYFTDLEAKNSYDKFIRPCSTVGVCRSPGVSFYDRFYLLIAKYDKYK